MMPKVAQKLHFLFIFSYVLDTNSKENLLWNVFWLRSVKYQMRMAWELINLPVQAEVSFILVLLHFFLKLA